MFLTNFSIKICFVKITAQDNPCTSYLGVCALAGARSPHRFRCRIFSTNSKNRTQKKQTGRQEPQYGEVVINLTTGEARFGRETECLATWHVLCRLQSLTFGRNFNQSLECVNLLFSFTMFSMFSFPSGGVNHPSPPQHSDRISLLLVAMASSSLGRSEWLWHVDGIHH